MFKKPNLYRGLACVFAFLLIMSVLASSVLEENRIMVDQTFKTNSQLIVSEADDGSLYTAFIPDDDFLTYGKLDVSKDEAVHRALGIRISEEGSVL